MFANYTQPGTKTILGNFICVIRVTCATCVILDKCVTCAACFTCGLKKHFATISA